jgi:hypothetical protein
VGYVWKEEIVRIQLPFMPGFKNVWLEAVERTKRESPAQLKKRLMESQRKFIEKHKGKG